MKCPVARSGIATASASGVTPVVNDFRLTLASADPVPSTDQSAKADIYLTPFTGNQITLENASGNLEVFDTDEVSLSVAGLAAGELRDVYASADGDGVVSLSMSAAWTSATARSEAISRSSWGFWTKDGDTTKRYLGTFRVDTGGGVTTDSEARRFLWNCDNRIPRSLRAPPETTDSWTYSTATYRQANANASNQVELVAGLSEAFVDLSAHFVMQHNSVGNIGYAAIGEDSTTAPATGFRGGLQVASIANRQFSNQIRLTKPITLGYHYYAWLERGNGTATCTWFGDHGTPTLMQCGLGGFVS